MIQFKIIKSLWGKGFRGLLTNRVTWTTHSVVAIHSMQGALVTEKGNKEKS